MKLSSDENPFCARFANICWVALCIWGIHELAAKMIKMTKINCIKLRSSIQKSKKYFISCRVCLENEFLTDYFPRHNLSLNLSSDENPFLACFANMWRVALWICGSWFTATKITIKAKINFIIGLIGTSFFLRSKVPEIRSSIAFPACHPRVTFLLPNTEIWAHFWSFRASSALLEFG